MARLNAAASVRTRRAKGAFARRRSRCRRGVALRRGLGDSAGWTGRSRHARFRFARGVNRRRIGRGQRRRDRSRYSDSPTSLWRGSHRAVEWRGAGDRSWCGRIAVRRPRSCGRGAIGIGRSKSRSPDGTRATDTTATLNRIAVIKTVSIVAARNTVTVLGILAVIGRLVIVGTVGLAAFARFATAFASTRFPRANLLHQSAR